MYSHEFNLHLLDTCLFLKQHFDIVITLIEQKQRVYKIVDRIGRPIGQFVLQLLSRNLIILFREVLC
jgi:hypothetical protein